MRQKSSPFAQESEYGGSGNVGGRGKGSCLEREGVNKIIIKNRYTVISHLKGFDK